MPYAHNMSEATREKIKVYQREYQREYKARNPEKVQRYKLASAVHLLNQNGLLVIPVPSALPWNTRTKTEILKSVLMGMQEQFGEPSSHDMKGGAADV